MVILNGKNQLAEPSAARGSPAADGANCKVTPATFVRKYSDFSQDEKKEFWTDVAKDPANALLNHFAPAFAGLVTKPAAPAVLRGLLTSLITNIVPGGSSLQPVIEGVLSAHADYVDAFIASLIATSKEAKS